MCVCDCCVMARVLRYFLGFKLKSVLLRQNAHFDSKSQAILLHRQSLIRQIQLVQMVKSKVVKEWYMIWSLVRSRKCVSIFFLLLLISLNGRNCKWYCSKRWKSFAINFTLVGYFSYMKMAKRINHFQ